MGTLLAFPQPEYLDLPLREREKFPTFACVYLVKDIAHEVLYVGQTVNARNRWENHQHYDVLSCDYEGVTVLFVPLEDARERQRREKLLVSLYRPRLNGISTNSLSACEPGQAGKSPNRGYAATGRTREYLTEAEIDELLQKARNSGQKQKRHRNYCIILEMFRHGLRVSEAVDLRWSDYDFATGTVLVRRRKHGRDSTHYLTGDEIRALKRLQRETKHPSPFLFLDGREKPLETSAIASAIKRLGVGLFGFPIHAHMLRHSCGHALAMRGMDTRALQDYLGHVGLAGAFEQKPTVLN